MRSESVACTLRPQTPAWVPPSPNWMQSHLSQMIVPSSCSWEKVLLILFRWQNCVLLKAKTKIEVVKVNKVSRSWSDLPVLFKSDFSVLSDPPSPQTKDLWSVGWKSLSCWKGQPYRSFDESQNMRIVGKSPKTKLTALAQSAGKAAISARQKSNRAHFFQDKIPCDTILSDTTKNLSRSVLVRLEVWRGATGNLIKYFFLRKDRN